MSARIKQSTYGRKIAADLKVLERGSAGGNRATLTLADGRTIDLNEEQGGIVVSSNDITYIDGSDLSADASELAGKVIAKLTLRTPRGGQYRVTSPDGSRVWLNSASTLTYPSRFDGGERLVELSGEGYFEVARDAARPFTVRSRGQSVEVLGTEFNISAYPDDYKPQTTLEWGMIPIWYHRKTA